MSETRSAPQPQQAEAPAPATQPTSTAQPDSPPASQPGAVPQATPAAAVSEPTPTPEALPPAAVSAPTATAEPEPTAAPEPTVPITPCAVATTAEAVPEPTPAPTATVPLPEPTVTSVTNTEVSKLAEPMFTPVAAPETAVSQPTVETSTFPMATEQTPVAVTNSDTKDATSTEPTATAETQADVPEPESSLTKKFTEQEWTALKEFRALLPDIFAEAFPDNAGARNTSVNIWGIDIHPAQPKADARVSVILVKFLRAHDLHVSQTREKFIGTLRWRESFNVPAALDEKFPQDVFENLGHIYGHDKEGRPVVYNIYGGNQDLKAVFGDVQRFIRWRVALMEKSVARLDFTEIDQTIQVHDYEGVGLTSRDTNSKAAAAEATNIFQNHYPELLFKKYFINVPTILNWIFWVFKPLISANTLAKMSVVGTGQHSIKKALSEHIDTKDLPNRYGGDAEAF